MKLIRNTVWLGLAFASYWLLVRPWHLRWGATDGELDEALAGDELVPQPQIYSTRAITVRAPSDHVWAWLVQIGQDRAGFYSYTWLENLLDRKEYLLQVVRRV